MKQLVVVLTLLMLGTVAYAQRNGGGGNNASPEVRAEQQTKMMTEQLGLSKEQQKQVYKLNMDRGIKMNELRESQNREGMRTVNEDFQKQLMAVLTPEQVKKYEAMEAERRQNGGPQGRGGRGPR